MLKADIKAVLAKKGWLTLLRYAGEAVGVGLLMLVFALLPLDWASALGGWIGRTVGPRLGVHRRARRNVQRAMPELGIKEQALVLRGMWDNLGRTIAEYPHIKTLQRHGRITVEGVEHLYQMRDDKRAGLFLGGHIANWEIVGLAPQRIGIPLTAVYRKPNNPFVARLLNDSRQRSVAKTTPKGFAGGLSLLRTLKQGGHVVMLVDQKLNEGLPLTFFGQPAMTAMAAAQWALQMNLPITLLRSIRHAGDKKGDKKVRFTIQCLPHPLPQSRDPESAAALMQGINSQLEAWIRQYPSQWLWLHNRWVAEGSRQSTVDRKNDLDSV